MRQVSLVFLIKNDPDGRKILLAMKKRGFGQGKWNGVGGKIDESKGDSSVLDSARRETKEEIDVDVLRFEKVAEIDFFFPAAPKDKDWNQQVHVYLAHEWRGEPVESEEMAPQWFNANNLPYHAMWSDDPYWLPKMLAGEKFKATFYFDEEQNVIPERISFSAL